MKKLILLILVLCTLTSCAKKNEEFEIRNGIKFGMSKEEVIAIEGEPEDYSESSLDYCSEYIFEDISAGVNFGFIDNSLVNIFYLIDHSRYTEDEGDLWSEDHARIDKALKNKYGKPRFDEVHGVTHYAIWMDRIGENDLISITYIGYEKAGHLTITYEYLEDSYEKMIRFWEEELQSNNNKL